MLTMLTMLTILTILTVLTMLAILTILTELTVLHTSLVAGAYARSGRCSDPKHVRSVRWRVRTSEYIEASQQLAIAHLL